MQCHRVTESDISIHLPALLCRLRCYTECFGVALELSSRQESEKKRDITVDEMTAATIQELQDGLANAQESLASEKAEHDRTRRDAQVRPS